jgi:hypothetical protein
MFGGYHANMGIFTTYNARKIWKTLKITFKFIYRLQYYRSCFLFYMLFNG